MVAIQTIYTTQHRLAKHYLSKLRLASVAVHQGSNGAIYGLTMLDREWPQIQHWQSWSVKQSAVDQECLNLSKAFPLVGSDLLRIRQHPQEHAQWLKAALTAARQLQDARSECLILFQLFQTHFTINNLEEAGEDAQQLSDLATAVNDRLHMGRSIYARGVIHEERGQYAEARQCYQRSLTIFEEYRADTDMSSVLNGLGSVSLYLGEFQQGYAYLLRHLALAEASRQESDICRALLAIAQGLLSLENPREAEIYAQRGVALCRRLGYRGMLCGGLLTLGACAVEQNHLETAVIYYTEGIQVARAIGSLRNVIHGLSSLGYVLFRIDQHDQALTHFYEALEMARQAGLPRFICNILRNMATTHMAIGDLDTAAHELQEGLGLAQSLNSDLQKVRTLAIAVMLWQCRDQFEQAAIWAGLLVDREDIDMPVFAPVCTALEAALGTEQYQQALEQGRTLTLDKVVQDVQAQLKPMPA